MKIAFIGQKGIPATSGGVEEYVESLAVNMASCGHDVYVYARRHYTDKNIQMYKGVHIVHLPTLHTKHFDAIIHTFFASIHALFQKYDVIHYQSIGPGIMSFIPKLFLRNTAIVSTLQSQDYFHQKWNRFARFVLHLGERVMCFSSDKLIAVTPIYKKYVSEKYNVSSSVIPNGANVKNITSFDGIKQFGLEKNNYLVLISRLVKHKGIKYAISAFLKQERLGTLPDGLKLVIVGEGAHTDNYVSDIKRQASVSSRIIFTGKQSGVTLDELYAHAYLFIQPSESEGLSLALLAAMGHGTAVLVSDISENMVPIKEDGLYGFTFKSKDEFDLSDKLEFLLKEKALVSNIAKAGQLHIYENYSWTIITNLVLQTYQDTLKNKRQIFRILQTRKV